MGVNGAGRKNTTDAGLNLHPLFVRSMGSLFQPSGLVGTLPAGVPVSAMPKAPLCKGRCLPSGRRWGVLLTTHGSGLPAWRGRSPLGVSFERAKETKTRLGRSPLSTPLGYEAGPASSLSSARHPCCGSWYCHHTRLPWAAGPMAGCFPSPGLLWYSGVPAAGSQVTDSWEQRLTRVRP